MSRAISGNPAPLAASTATAFTWGQFKACIDAQVADLMGDDECVKFVSWDGNDKPIVKFEEDRRGRPVCGVV